MVPNNGYNAYAKNKIMTASPAELTLMLYEGAIKFCNIAVVAIENKDYAKADKIRDDLLAMGIKIIDSKDGQRWERI